MAEDRISTPETEGKPNTETTTRQKRESEADFEARIAQSLAHHVGEYVKVAAEARDPRPIIRTDREQLTRGTMNRLDALCGYVSIASKMLEWAAEKDLNAEHGDPPPLDSVHLETLARLLGRAARGMELTLNNADGI